MNESTALTDKDSIAKTENKAKIVATFFAWWKTDISQELAYKYWRDVHAIWAARTPGFYQYRQLHLNNVDPALLSSLEGIETNLPQEDQPNGMAHIYYSSSLMANLLRMPFALKQADQDDSYYVARNTYQRSSLPSSRTLVDKVNNPEINGILEHPRYVLAFKKGTGASEEDFRNYLINDLCKPWRQKNDVRRLRLELLDPHIDAPSSPDGVNHTWDKDKQYHAWIELGVAEGTELSSFFTQSADLEKNISAVHVYPIREIYTIVYGGKPTLVGLRGYPAVEIIKKMGAEFQTSEQVLKL